MHAGAAVCRSYEGHLQHHEYDKRWKLPKKEALVLFHYVTRSFQDFRERKLNRYAGAYANDFRIRKEKAVEKVCALSRMHVSLWC